MRELDPQVITSKQFCTLFDPFNIVGHNSPTVHELIIMCCAIRKYDLKNACEIGTYLGHTILNLAENVNLNVHYRPDAIVTVDLPLDKQVHLPAGFVNATGKMDIGIMLKDFPKITQVRKDSRYYDYDEFPFGVDFVFIDGCHAKEFVRADTQHALAHLSERGIVFWHDYCLEVKEYLDSLKIELYHITGTGLVMYRKGGL